MKSRLKPCHNTITTIQTDQSTTTAAGQLTLALSSYAEEGRVGRAVVANMPEAGHCQEPEKGGKMKEDKERMMNIESVIALF